MEADATAYVYRNLYQEMEGFEKSGVPMFMEGTSVSPMQVVTAHLIKEEGSYMRDYILNPKGYIESLTFVNVSCNN